ncbi:MAG: molecular chaperone TorD family protein [Omnitrophica bacterium]|nr:molecular chaperone TorD family protein [Candidatus Omnitrophota bacterium]
MKTKEFLLSQSNKPLSYRLLADCYYLPDEKLLGRLRDSKSLLNGLLSKLIENTPANEELKSLTVDFSMLFVGPFKLLAPPYGSIYLDSGNEVMGNSTISVRKLYEQEYLKIGLKEMPDHIAIELEFMHYLAVKEANADNGNLKDEVLNYRKKQLLFLSEHLGSWIDEFSVRVDKNAQTQFYKTLAKVSRAFIHDDLQSLRLKNC